MRQSYFNTKGVRLTTDISITYKMQAFFAGDVNRSHPVSIEPCLVDATNPPTFYGQAVLGSADGSNGVRAILTSDNAITAIYGIVARAYPTQQQTTNQPFGAIGIGAAPLAGGIQDIVRSGYVAVPVNGVTAKFGTVYIWVAAASGSHVVGGFEAASAGGSTIALDSKSTYNGVTNAQGLVELAFNI